MNTGYQVALLLVGGSAVVSALGFVIMRVLDARACRFAELTHMELAA